MNEEVYAAHPRMQAEYEALKLKWGHIPCSSAALEQDEAMRREVGAFEQGWAVWLNYEWNLYQQ